jgi:O-antigen/teichoic acid export membrane protein
VARVLGDGDFAADRKLFVAFFVLGITSSAQYAFSFGATGPRSMRASLWIDGSCALGNAVLSFALVGPLGLEGPVVASIVGSSVAVVVWIVVLAKRRELLSDVHEIAVVDGHGSGP